MKKIIVTGKNGQVGHALVEALAPICELHAFDSQEFDLSNAPQIRAHIQTIRPDIIINAAAYTAVDRAETEEVNAFAVNAYGPRIIGQEAAKIDASKIQNTLGWAPVETFESGIHKTVKWYLENEEWWQHVRDGSYRGDRLGMKGT